jgi:hypothetical protein
MTTTYLNTETVVDLVPITCGAKGCGVTFALDRQFVAARRADHARWYCPNGHSCWYPAKSEMEKLQDELAAARRIASNERDWRRREREQRERAERQRAAARGQVTKIKRRVGRGVCPCCNRTFADLGRHMAGQHPEFADGES